MLRRMVVGMFLAALTLSLGLESRVFSANLALAEEKAEEVNNKICPVSGEKIDEKTKATYEYKGKIYNFCCEMCIDEFKKDPEKYLKKIEEEKQKAAAQEKAEPAGHQHMHP